MPRPLSVKPSPACSQPCTVRLVAVVLGLVAVLVVGLGLLVYTSCPAEDGSWGYPDWAEVEQRLVTAQQSHGDLVTLEEVGRSVHDRTIYSLRVASPGSEGAPVVWVVCGLHAREWTSPLACLHILESLLAEVRTDPLLQRFHFHLLPLANPDGYVYSMTRTGDPMDRLKRKNMAGSGCYDPLHDGVDLNRNFPLGWNTTEGCLSYRRSLEAYSSCPCSPSYPGPAPFSEPETQAVRAALAAAPPWLLLDIHGSQGAWLSPWAGKEGAGPPAWQLGFLTPLLEAEYGVRYSTGPASQLVGLVGGTLLDWVAGGLGVERTYAVELHSECPVGEEGLAAALCLFQCPVSQARRAVVPVVWGGLKALVEWAHREDWPQGAGV